MTTFILIAGGAVALAIIGIMMNRSRNQRGNADHHGAYYTDHSQQSGSSHHHTGDVGGREVTHDGGGFDWGDSGSGGDGGGGDGGGGDGGGGE